MTMPRERILLMESPEEITILCMENPREEDFENAYYMRDRPEATLF
jgi:hypothetical protein